MVARSRTLRFDLERQRVEKKKKHIYGYYGLNWNFGCYDRGT
jgi:hypothetical protein